MRLLVLLLFCISLGANAQLTANKTEENRQAVHQEIIPNPIQLTNFISEVRKNEEAKLILMKGHMEQMESGNMKMMMEKNPEMQENMQAHMQKMMENNPEMMQKMHSKILDKMMESVKGRKMLMDKIQSNGKMKEDMKAKMMQMMDQNPEMMKEMMQKLKGKMKNKG